MRGGEKMTLRGLVSAVHYNGQAVTLLRANDCGDRWVVRLEAAVWMQKELVVKPLNLVATQPHKSLPDKVREKKNQVNGQYCCCT